MARPRRSRSASAAAAVAALLCLSAISSTDGFAPPVRNAALRPNGIVAAKYHRRGAAGTAAATAALRARSEGRGDDEKGMRRREGKRAALRRLLSRIPTSAKRLRRRAAPAALAFLTAASLSLRPGAHVPSLDNLNLNVGIPAAHARTPTQALQNLQEMSREESDVALEAARAKRDREKREEAMQHKKECERIESEEGKGARKKYEREYEESKESEREAKAIRRVELMDELLQRGICPFADPEGVRQMMLHDEGIDLAYVDGTEQSYDRIEVLSGRGDKVLKKYENARFIVKCQADDMRLHGKDPASYFAEHKESTEAIYSMPEYQQKKMADRYREIIAEHGSLNPVKEGEKEANEAAEAEAKAAKSAEESDAKAKAEAERAEKKAKQEEAKRRREEERAAAKAEKEAAKAAKKAEKEEAKAAKKAEKEAANAAKTAAKVASAAATAAASHPAADAEIAATSGMDMMATAGQEAVTPSHMADADGAAVASTEGEETAEGDGGEGEEAAAVATTAAAAAATPSSPSPLSKIPVIPTVAGVGVLGGGGYAFKVMRDRAAEEEEERQRQFRLIMGDKAAEDDDDEDEDDADEDADEDEEDDNDSGAADVEDAVEEDDGEAAEPGEVTGTSDAGADLEASTSGSDFPSMMPPKGGGKAADKPKPKPAAAAAKKAAPEPTQTEQPAPSSAAAPKKKKRRGGIASMFSKKSNGRETDLSELVGPKGKTPSFSSTVAKLLTFGAPGRFPDVQSLPGGMPLDTYDLDAARAILAAEKANGGIADQDAAEAFATVVNCMIVDIIDLASSTLGEKDKGQEKKTAEAINIVMDFMDHAAGLFEPFLVEGVEIKPVTYGGTLGRNKLEQLYSTYATAVMTTEGVTQDRIDMLQELFEIKDKKAEGLVQKKMLGSLMKMMKDPEAMKDLEGGPMGEGMAEMMEAMGGMEGMEGLAGMDPNAEVSPEEIKESVKLMKDLVESGGVSKEEMDLVKEQFKAQYGMDIKEIIEQADSDEVKEQLGDQGEELIEMFKAILKQTE